MDYFKIFRVILYPVALFVGFYVIDRSYNVLALWYFDFNLWGRVFLFTPILGITWVIGENFAKFIFLVSPYKIYARVLLIFAALLWFFLIAMNFFDEKIEHTSEEIFLISYFAAILCCYTFPIVMVSTGFISQKTDYSSN